MHAADAERAYTEKGQFETENVSLKLRNVSLRLKNVSLRLRNVSLRLRNVTLELRNVSLRPRNVSFERAHLEDVVVVPSLHLHLHSVRESTATFPIHFAWEIVPYILYKRVHMKVNIHTKVNIHMP
jgi:hypothetical protein